MLFRITIDLEKVPEVSGTIEDIKNFFASNPEIPFAFEKFGDSFVFIHFVDGCVLAREAVRHIPTCVLTYDDFNPDYFPWWIERVGKIIKEVNGEACYGDRQGIEVDEFLEHNSARALVRNVMVSPGVFATVVKISAIGETAIMDAWTLHLRILTHTA